MSKRGSIKQFLGIGKNHNEGQTSKDSNSQASESNGKDLPEAFAEEILKLEMEMDLNDKVDIKTLHRLIELYSLGVGHYEAIGDTKYLYFHKKMNNLMIKPSVLESMNNSAQEKKDRINQESETKDITSPQKSELIDEQINNHSQSIKSDSDNLHDLKQTDGQVTQNNNSEIVKKDKQPEEIKVIAEQKRSKQINQMKRKTIEENIKMNIVYQMQESEEKSQSILKMHQLDSQRVKEMVKKQVGNQMDDIKKRLENRKSLANKALSLPLLTDSDSSLSDLDIVLPLYDSDKKISSSNNLYGHNAGETILEDEFEDHFTLDNSRRNSFDFQQLREGNHIVIDELKKERSVDEIILERRKSTMHQKTRKSTGQNRLANKVGEQNRNRASSNKVTTSLSSLSKMLKEQSKQTDDSQQENNDQ